VIHPDPRAEKVIADLGDELSPLNPLRAAAVLGGLLTLPALQANTPRLEALTTAVAAVGAGGQAPGRGRLTGWLNTGVRGVAVTEDPPEDAFLLPVLTDFGEFRVFEGVFEKNAAVTDALLEALADLSREEPDVTELMFEAFALMSVSEAIATRARLARAEYGGGSNGEDIELPPSDRLSALGRRVQFSRADLAAARAPLPLLKPYLLDVRAPAEERGPLRRRPVLTDGATFVVGAPSYLLAAWRQRVAIEAESAPWGARLAEKLVFAELRRVAESDFERLPDRLFLKSAGPFVATSILRDHGPGRWVHMVVVGDSFAKASEASLDEMAPDGEQIGAFLAEQVASAEKFVADKDGFIAGAHLILLCGWGRGLMCRLPSPAAGWTIIHAPAHDLVTMGALGVKLDDLWRIEKQKERLAQAGIRLFNLNGTLNLVQYWRSTDNLLTPNVEDATVPLTISVGTDYVLPARREAFTRLGLRSLPLREGGPFLRVRRKATSSWFVEAENLMQFMAMGMVMHGETVGAVAVDGLAPVWVEVPKACGSPTHRVPMLDTAIGWTERAVKALASAGKGPHEVLHLTFQIPPEAGVQAYEAAAEVAGSDIADTIQVHKEGKQATFEVSPAWFGRWRDKANTAERALAERILTVINNLTGRPANAATLARLATVVVPDDRARYRHAIAAQAYYDLIQGVDMLAYRDIPESAAALAKTGLAWDALGRNVVGLLPEADVLPTIRATVAHLLDKVAARAQALDHAALVRQILRRLEGANIDERLWMDTAGSALSLADDRADAEAVLRDQMWAGTAVRVGCRLLAEIVGSVPPGGAVAKPEPGVFDVDEMLADTVLALQMGDLHAEIENGVTPPKVAVSLSGELLSQQDFGEAVVQPVGERVANRRIRSEIRRYERRVVQQEAVPTVDGKLPAEYGEALAAEFGLTMDGIRTVRDELEDVALEKGEAVFRMRRSEVVKHIVAERGLPEPAVQRFFDQLTMPVRTTWSEPPEGFSRQEVEPWRSGRRLGFYARPLLPLDAGDDPELMIAPGALGTGLEWLTRRAFEGALPKEFWSSPQMKAWSIEATARESAEFAEDVGHRLEKLGLEVEVGVYASKILNTKTPPELGDIDVFAVDRARSRVWIVEVKDLGLCRSQREIALRLADYAGQVNSRGRPDPMMKHLRRVRYVREQATGLAKHNRLTTPVDVRGLLVVSTPQPMMVVEPADPDARVVLLDDLGAAIEV
jgi:hypothetical protein